MTRRKFAFAAAIATVSFIGSASITGGTAVAGPFQFNLAKRSVETGKVSVRQRVGAPYLAKRTPSAVGRVKLF